MNKLLLLSTILFLALSSQAQLYQISYDMQFKDQLGDTLAMPLAGGLNQPHFSTIDLDNDGKLDLFAFDRTGEKILTFLNRGTVGTPKYIYAPEYEEVFPQGKQFMMLKDYNNDQKLDLWTYTGDSVVVYKNYSSGLPDLRKHANLYALDSVSYRFNYPPELNLRPLTQVAGCLPAIEDLDHDGDIDMVTNLNPTGSAMVLFANQSIDSGYNLDQFAFNIPDKCYGGIDEFGGELIIDAPCLFRETYKCKKKHAATKSLLYIDMDDDGDYDLFYGSSERLTNPIYYFENGRVNLQNCCKDTFIAMDTAYFPPQVEAKIPVAPAMSFIDVDNDGVKDLILSTNEMDVRAFPIRQTQNVLFFFNKGTNELPDFDYTSNEFLVGDMVDLGAFTAPTFADIDDDGDQDLFVGTNQDHYVSGDTSFVIFFYENIGDPYNPVFQLQTTDFLTLSIRYYEKITPTFVDINGDQLLDLFIGKADGTISYFKNVGSKTAPSFVHQTDNWQNIWVLYDAAPKFYDFDGNGTYDMFLGQRHGPIRYYQNTGSKIAPTMTLMADTFGKIMVNEMVYQQVLGPNGFYDTLVYLSDGNPVIDIVNYNDSMTYLAVGGLEGKVRLFEMGTHYDSTFKELTNYMHHDILGESYTKDWGWGAIPAAADLNGDRVSDLLIGNYRGGLTYLKGIDTINSIPKLPLLQFSVSPNPTQGLIHVDLPRRGEHTYVIYDITGKELQTGTIEQHGSIRFGDNWATGLYFLEMQTKGVRYAPRKVILGR